MDAPVTSVARVRTVGRILPSALHRRRVEAALLARVDEIRQLQARLEAENVSLQEEVGQLLLSLRERREDIPLLVWAIIQRYRAATGRHVDRVPERVMAALVSYAWPGNVRELENVIERALILSPGSVLRLDGPLASAAEPLSRPRYLPSHRDTARPGGAGGEPTTSLPEPALTASSPAP